MVTAEHLRLNVTDNVPGTRVLDATRLENILGAWGNTRRTSVIESRKRGYVDGSGTNVVHGGRAGVVDSNHTSDVDSKGRGGFGGQY